MARREPDSRTGPAPLPLGFAPIGRHAVNFNAYPGVHRAELQAKDRWADLFRDAIYHYEHDEALLLKLVSAIQQTSKRGFMRNPSSFEEVLDRTASGLRSSRRDLEAKLEEQHIKQVPQSSSIRVCASRWGEHHPSIRASGGHCIDRYSEGA